MHSRNKLLLSALVAAVLFIGDAQDVPDIPAVFPAIMHREQEAMMEPCDDHSEKKEYDFIVVGAGPAGCVVTSRLTEIRQWDVLLLEAGGEETAIMDVPGLGGTLLDSDIAWNYKTAPSEDYLKSFQNQRSNYGSGKVMGGGTSVITLVNVRGNRHAYDNWEKLGNPGWSYDDVLHYFKKIEQIEIPRLRNSKYHSTEGKIKVSYPSHTEKIVSYFLEAGKEMGYSEVDYNGENETGVSLTQSTMGNGTRWSASRGYLHPIRNRENLYVKKRALVTKILIDEDTKTAYGVQFMKEGRNHTVYARREVILSAGAIKSPQLLMISGIGPRENLEELGISVIKDSNVGYNATDHGVFLGLFFTTKETLGPKLSEIFSNPQNYIDYYLSGKGPLSSNWASSLVHSFLELENTPYYSPGWPVVESLMMYPSVVADEHFSVGYGLTDEVRNEFMDPLVNTSNYQILIFPIKPLSRGRIYLQDTNIEVQPILNLNVYGNDEDIDMVVAGIREMIKFSQTPALQKLGTKLYDTPLPACKHLRFNSDDYWRCAVVQTSLPFWHIAGTCKMGPSTDRTAVVDPELKVYGVKGLRVIDASIFPEHPSPFPQMPTYMVGEKGADLIKADYLGERS